MTMPPLASTPNAGGLLSNYRFKIPSYQREYSWNKDEVDYFWEDIQSGIEEDGYFLGLVILTENEGVMNIVDGQQRIVTLALLAKVLHNRATKLNRKALADLIESTFLRFADYTTDEKNFRISFADSIDNAVFQQIIEKGFATNIESSDTVVNISLRQMVKALEHLELRVNDYLGDDGSAFRRLGKLTEFIKEKLYFTVFVHPDEASAYRIFEAINTRGLDLTTADLLKSYVLRTTPDEDKGKTYDEWQRISREFSSKTFGSTFVQYIKHVVNVECGHIRQKELYDFISENKSFKKSPPSPRELLNLLSKRLDIYRQIDNPNALGPIKERQLEIVSAFNSIGIITVRPILIALYEMEDEELGTQGMEELLRLVVRRMAVGNIGAGLVESQFGDVAKIISDTGDWKCFYDSLTDFDQSKESFIDHLAKRSFNKRTLTFIRQSIVQKTIVPQKGSHFHLIWPRYPNWKNLKDEDSYWASTLGNSILSTQLSRPSNSLGSWGAFKDHFLSYAADGEIADVLRKYEKWDREAVAEVGKGVAEIAASVWYP